MRYVQEHTELPNLSFWKKLTPEAQMKACQFLVMHELSETNYFRIDPSQDKASVYVVLSGTAHVKDGIDGEENIYNVGEIFGSTSMFDEAVKNPNSFDFDNLPDHLTTMENSKQVSMHKGTYMRLSLFDFHRQVLKDPAEEEQKMRDEAVKISGIRWEDLTEDDKFYIRVYKRTRQLINADLFAFLDAYRLIPKNARTPAYRYYREGIFGRELHLDPEEALSVYIIIDGGIRLDIEAHREDPQHNVHALSCKRKGKKPMVVMTRSMPILLLESGSLMFPSTECHTIGVEGEYGLGGRDGGGAGGRYGDDDTSVSDQSMSTLPSVTSHHHFPPADHRRMSMSPPRTANLMTTANSSGNGPVPGNSYSHLSFMAQPHTSAQGIPLPGHVIKRQLQRSNDAIVKRITSLLPWLNGKLTLRPGTVNPIAEEDEQANKAKDQDIDTTDSPAMYGTLMGSYGKNILSSSMETLMGRSKPPTGANGMRKTPGTAPMSGPGGGAFRPGGKRAKSNNQLMKSLKEQLVAKQSPPIFLTITAAGSLASKGKRRAQKRTVSRDEHDPSTADSRRAGSAGGGRDRGDDVLVPDINTAAALSASPLPPLETVSEV
eukprot:gene221-146_t